MPEFAFAGRSNVGKSSLLNLLVGKRDLARVSPTPGHTKHLNFFTVNGRWRLVDLPGYGYARVERAERGRFSSSVMQYLAGAGLTQLRWTDVDVAYAFTSGNTALTDPYQGVKGQQFRVTVTLNQAALNKCLWSALGLVRPTSVAYAVHWQIMVDDPFSINPNLPTW